MASHVKTKAHSIVTLIRISNLNTVLPVGCCGCETVLDPLRKDTDRWRASWNRTLTGKCWAGLDRGSSIWHNAQQVRINKQAKAKNCLFVNNRIYQIYLYQCIILCILENIRFHCFLDNDISKTLFKQLLNVCLCQGLYHV